MSERQPYYAGKCVGGPWDGRQVAQRKPTLNVQELADNEDFIESLADPSKALEPLAYNTWTYAFDDDTGTWRLM